METWTQTSDATTATVTGRTPVSLRTKCNPIWWLLDDEDRTAPLRVNGITYLPDQPTWWRNLCWWFRNPAANFMEYVIGVRDRNYTIHGTAPVRDGTLADSGRLGWKASVITLTSGIKLGFVSYAGPKWLWYLGWRAEGGFGIKINRHG